jgi:hypothetical protein
MAVNFVAVFGNDGVYEITALASGSGCLPFPG